MRIGFLITLSEQIELFEAVLRRTPGARFLLPAGRWPSTHLDSRAEILRILQERRLPPVIEARGEFDLVVAPGDLPSSTLLSWLRPGGAWALWRGPRMAWSSPGASLLLAAGPAFSSSLSCQPSAIVGDPILDTALETGARSRARHALGIDTSDQQAVILLHGEANSTGLSSLGPQISLLRTEAWLVVTCSTLKSLDESQPLPPALIGPGVIRPGRSVPRAELLAAADLVLAEPGSLLLEAAALGRPCFGLGSWNLKRARSGAAIDPVHETLQRWEWVDDGEGLRRVLDWPLEEKLEFSRLLRPWAETLVGPADGHSVQRFVSALQLLGGGKESFRELITR